MTLKERIEVLTILSEHIKNDTNGLLDAVSAQAIAENPWFTPDGIKHALESVTEAYLDKLVLDDAVSRYDIKDDASKKVGLVLAGNIPMVGIHDVICTFLAGHTSLIKYSSKDKVLIAYLISVLAKIDARTEERFVSVNRLKDMDAVIATGGSTAATHFDYYFSKYPHIIRKNRSSVAVLDGSESAEELKSLGEDIFMYFGLGCRNVSKLYVPRDYKFDFFFESIVDFGYVNDHNKYKNNYDYSNAIYLIGQHIYLTNNFLIVREDSALSARISCIHYEYYDDKENLTTQLKNMDEEIQCFVSKDGVGDLPHTAFGDCQKPQFLDYADRVDTMSFLTSLYDSSN